MGFFAQNIVVIHLCEFPNLSAIDIFGLDDYLLWGTALCILRCSQHPWSLPMPPSHNTQMSPDIASCFLVDKITPNWEPFFCVTMHSRRTFSFTDVDDFTAWICYYWFIHSSVDEICISPGFCYYKACNYEYICAWPLVYVCNNSSRSGYVRVEMLACEVCTS